MEWATAGRPRPGEHASGDQSIAIGIDSGAALFAVLDGLGHGPDAAKAAMAAADAIENTIAEKRVEVLVQLCHRVLGGTQRGRDDAGARRFRGRPTALDRCRKRQRAPGRQDARRHPIRSAARLAAGIVGYRIPEITPAQVVPIRAGDLIIVASDGIAEITLDHLDFATTATVIADQILGKHAKETDDALVLAARHRGGLNMTDIDDFHAQYIAALQVYWTLATRTAWPSATSSDAAPSRKESACSTSSSTTSG